MQPRATALATAAGAAGAMAAAPLLLAAPADTTESIAFCDAVVSVLEQIRRRQGARELREIAWQPANEARTPPHKHGITNKPRSSMSVRRLKSVASAMVIYAAASAPPSAAAVSQLLAHRHACLSTITSLH
jgi:hypothetical protein